MTRNTHIFAIEDELGTSDNLDAFARVLEEIDVALGAALRPYLTSIAAGHPEDPAAIWDALYAASENGATEGVA